MSDDLTDGVKVPKIRLNFPDGKVIEFDEETSAHIFLACALTGKTPEQVVETAISAMYEKHLAEQKETGGTEKSG